MSEYNITAENLLQKANLACKHRYFIEAQQEYQHFFDFHPTSEQAVRAQFQLAMCFFNQIPKNIEWDMTSAERALGEFQTLITNYPDDTKYLEGVREKIFIVRSRLAEKEFKIAMFYLKIRKNPAAARARFQYAVENYDDTEFGKKSAEEINKLFMSDYWY